MGYNARPAGTFSVQARAGAGIKGSDGGLGIAGCARFNPQASAGTGIEDREGVPDAAVRSTGAPGFPQVIVGAGRPGGLGCKAERWHYAFALSNR